MVPRTRGDASACMTRRGNLETMSEKPHPASGMAEKKPHPAPGMAEKPAPPFPWAQVLILLLVNVSEPLAITLCFPIAPFMVGDWVAADAVGVWAGALASVYNFSGIPFNVVWGWLSDRKGRRAVLTIQVCGTAGALVGFGLSGSLAEALCWCMLGGAFSGIGGVCKAALREMIIESQRGRAFSLLGWSW